MVILPGDSVGGCFEGGQIRNAQRHELRFETLMTQQLSGLVAFAK